MIIFLRHAAMRYAMRTIRIIPSRYATFRRHAFAMMLILIF